MRPSRKDRRASAPIAEAKSTSTRPGAERRNGVPAKPESSVPRLPASRLLRVALPLAVIGIAFVAFLPALSNGFVNWDDDKVLLENEHFRGLGWPQLQWMASAYWLGHYHPLTWLSFAVDYRLWGLDEESAFGFHLTNVILHALNAGLFYLLARRLLALAIPPADKRSEVATRVAAALAALLFAIHPLRVESVAWVTERRDVLSTLFLLPCVLAYLRYATGTRGRWVWYGASIVLLLVSLLSKAWGLTLPAVLLIVDWYPLRRFREGAPFGGRARVAGILAEKLPFLTLAAWAAYHAVRAQSTASSTMKTLAEYGLLPRAAQAFYGIVFYPWKTLLPTGLVPIYEIPLNMNPFEARYIVAAVLVVAITAAVLLLRRRWPAGLALWACYGVIVSPVLGLTQAGPQLVADRYSYIACTTWALLAGAGLVRLVRRFAADSRRNVVLAAVGAGTIGILGTLGALAWRQTLIWRDSEILWRHTLAVAPDSYNAHTNLAVVLHSRGDNDGAEGHYRAALVINPDGTEALRNFGVLLSNTGRPAEALPYLQRWLARNPDQAAAYANLAITLQLVGRYEEAVALYRARLAVDDTPAQQAALYAGLGGALGSLGRLSEAADCLRQAVALAPQDDFPSYNLGVTLRRMGDADGALQAFEEAARAAQDIVRADHRKLSRTCLVEALVCAGVLQAAKGDPAAARDRFQRALQLDPEYEPAREGLRRIEGP
jgi:Tfp pilus assembly protein PilF